MKTRLAFTLPGVLVAVPLLSAVPAQAGPILLDQSFTPTLSRHIAVSPGERYAQTLTVGITGLMTGIDLSLTRENNPPAMGDLVVSILGTISGAPDDSTTLATAITPASYWMWRHLPSDDLNSYRHIEFSPFAVTAGTQLAITVSVADSGGTFHWIRGDETRDYLPGQSFEWRPADGGWTPILSGWQGYDYAFRSYVAVPDPGSTLLLFGTGLVGLRAWRRRPQ